LEQMMASRKENVDTAVVSARKNVEEAKSALTRANRYLKDALESRAEHAGRLSELRKQWAGEDPQAAELALREATARYDSLPIPDRHVNTDELVSAKNHKASATLQL